MREMHVSVPVRTKSVQPSASVAAPADAGFSSASTTHPTLLMNTDAKCPSALQVSGMAPEGKLSPDAVVTPLAENERTVPTTSLAVAFSKSPLRRRALSEHFHWLALAGWRHRRQRRSLRQA